MRIGTRECVGTNFGHPCTLYNVLEQHAVFLQHHIYLKGIQQPLRLRLHQHCSLTPPIARQQPQVLLQSILYNELLGAWVMLVDDMDDGQQVALRWGVLRLQ